ncbi:hypothetical protein Tco_0814132 [Tanacetum coccineum]
MSENIEKQNPKFAIHEKANPLVAKVSASTSHSGISPDVSELKDMVKALLLDKKNQSQAPAHQTPAPVKAIGQSCVTCGGGHSYQNCPATDGNIYRDNIQEYVSQAAAVNYNQGNASYRPQMVANQIRPPVPPAPGVSKPDFDNYVKANDAVMQNMQNQMANITDLITKFVNSNTTSASGSLPSNTIANPKGDVKAITTRSGVSYNGPQISSPPKEKENKPEVTKDTVQPSTENIQPLVVQTNDQIGEPVWQSHFYFGPYDRFSLSIFHSLRGTGLSNWKSIDKFLEHDDSIPPGVDGIYDSEGDTVYLEELLSVINSDPNLPPSPVCEINVPEEIKSSCEDPPDLELKDLPSHLEYAFLEGDDKLPVIIAKNLKDEDKTALIKVLKSHKHAIAWNFLR